MEYPVDGSRWTVERVEPDLGKTGYMFCSCGGTRQYFPIGVMTEVERKIRKLQPDGTVKKRKPRDPVGNDKVADFLAYCVTHDDVMQVARDIGMEVGEVWVERAGRMGFGMFRMQMGNAMRGWFKKNPG
jgi:hypothetical protein